MKNKKMILPSIVLSVSAVLLVLTLLFTTNFVFCTGLNTFNLNRIEKSGNITEFAYKISPSYSNLQSMYCIYKYSRYYDYEDGFVTDKGEMPENYFKKCIEYSKKMYEYYLANPEAYKSRQNSHASFDVAYFSQEQALAETFSSYVVALYLDGQKTEAQIEADKFLRDFSKNLSNEKMAPVFAPFYGYVVTVHDLEEDPDYQKWMVEFEEKVTKAYYEANTDAEDKCENLYARDESYKPFDWQK